MSDDLHALAGLYALDALDDVETARFERHLAECDVCATEVREFREVAHRIGADGTAVPPPALRARVLAEVGSTAQLRRRPGTGRGRRPVVAAALGVAASVVAVAALAAALVSTRHDLAESRSLAAALSDPDAEVMTYRGDGGVMARLVGAPGADRLVVVLADLPAIDADRAYALWLIGADGPAMMGMVRPDSSGHAVAMIDADLAGYTAFGLTNEPAGGSPAPTGPLLVTGAVPA
jgi:anti-sigma-K factor RskA